MPKIDTIAAVSTAWGEGGIGIVRLSGPDALDCALKVFSLKKDTEIRDRYLYYGEIKGNGSVIDNGFLAYMRGPRSYTGEDVVELHCHGGPLILKNVLEALLKNGARGAEPGEFTKRAFLNGKLDLAQAESVIDVIRAETELSLSSARGRLAGALSAKVNSIKEGLLTLLTHIEAELDFSEEELDGLSKDRIFSGLKDARVSLEKMLSTYGEGKVLKDGIRVLILGRPNVGKSSLLNILLREERAIVTPIPGTTRDVIEEVVNIRGLPIRLQDTAGLRETADHVESIGVRAARDRIATSELILFVIDASFPSFYDDLALLNEAGGKKLIIVANKADLADGIQEDGIKKAFEGRKICFISALRSSGIEELKDLIYEEALGRPYGSAQAPAGELITSSRHKDSLEKALEGIGRTEDALNEDLPKEFVATDLRWSVDRLGEITGETTTEDILDRIFSNFCIGK